MGQPGFWDDQDLAARTSADHARAQRRLETFRGLESDVADLADLAEMAAEDEEIAAELGSQLVAVEGRLAELEEGRLFSGEYDAGDAVVTVHAGAGGTDSQDWAEILLRMYLRWSERRGFDVEMVEASPGEEAGLKSGTFIARGENAYGLFAAERGVHRLVRISPSTPPRAGTPASPRLTSARWSTTGSRSRSTTATSASTPTGPPAPAASTSTRPTRRCGSPTSRPTPWSSARTSARRPRTRRWRCSCCARS